MNEVSLYNCDGLATITLNRAEKQNALNREMIRALAKIFSDLKKKNQKTRVVYLKGEGPSFCAGADLAMMKASIDQTLLKNQREAEELFDLFYLASECPVPVITRVHGYAMGGALGLVCVSDVVAIVEGTQMAFSEVKLGIVPAVISGFCLQKLGLSHSRRLMLTGERFDAREALHMGLAHFVGDEGGVDRFCQNAIGNVLQSGPEAVRETKKLIKNVYGKNLRQTRSLTAKVIAHRRRSREGQEGLRGFLEKKSVSWKKEL